MLKSTKDKKGWLLPYLLALDNMFFKRWDYWLNICNTNQIPQEPIPCIPFKPIYEYPQKETQKNLQDCLKFAERGIRFMPYTAPLSAWVPSQDCPILLKVQQSYLK